MRRFHPGEPTKGTAFRHLNHILKAGLFSATIAAFIIESYYKLLSPDSGDTAEHSAIQTNSLRREGQRVVVPQLGP